MSPDDSVNSMNKDTLIGDIESQITREKKIIREMSSLFNYLRNVNSPSEKNMVGAQLQALRNELYTVGNKIIDSAEQISLVRPLDYSSSAQTSLGPKNYEDESKPTVISEYQVKPEKRPGHMKKPKPDHLEKLAIERATKKDKKVVKKKEKKASTYVKFSSKMFHNFSTRLIEKGKFEGLGRDLVKANMDFIPEAYVSVIFFTTFLSVAVAFFVMLFFLFFNLTAIYPFIVPMQDTLFGRFLKVFWLMFFVPIVTFLSAYYYPSLEKKSIENRINQELPFAVVHMSSISSSMIEPSKIFGIIASTKEYPYLEKEFIKIQNEINIYGYDMITALRNRAYNSPSRKLSELFNGLSTTITSGGDLPEFFEKRAQTLLFEHRLEEEKQSKTAETFMDIYISTVIAAPMILMLLLMMMRISGLGISLSTGTISLIMVLAVSLMNILFLAFLHIKQPAK